MYSRGKSDTRFVFRSKTTVCVTTRQRKVKRTFCLSDSLCERKNFGTRGRRHARCVFSRILRLFEVRDVLVARESRTLSRRKQRLHLECALYFKRALLVAFLVALGFDLRDLEKRSKQRLREKKKRSRRVFVRALSMLFVGRVVGTSSFPFENAFFSERLFFFLVASTSEKSKNDEEKKKRNVWWFSDAH